MSKESIYCLRRIVEAVNNSSAFDNSKTYAAWAKIFNLPIDKIKVTRFLMELDKIVIRTYMEIMSDDEISAATKKNADITLIRVKSLISIKLMDSSWKDVRTTFESEGMLEKLDLLYDLYSHRDTQPKKLASEIDQIKDACEKLKATLKNSSLPPILKRRIQIKTYELMEIVENIDIFGYESIIEPSLSLAVACAVGGSSKNKQDEGKNSEFLETSRRVFNFVKDIVVGGREIIDALKLEDISSVKDILPGA